MYVDCLIFINDIVGFGAVLVRAEIEHRRFHVYIPTLSRAMKVAIPTFPLFRNSTHLTAVSIESTTMWSRAPQAVLMATSYFSSMAPRSP